MAPSIFVLLVLVATIALLMTDKIPIGVIGLLIPVALVLFGILEPKTAFLVLGDPLMLLVACAFVFGGAFFKVGLAQIIGDSVQVFADRFGKGSEAFIIVLAMTVTIVMSSVLPNLGVVAVLLPVFLSISKTTGIAAGRLLLPVAYASSVGGLITLIGSPNNLIGRGALEAAGAGTFGFFEFGWVGIPLSILCTLYLATIGRRWLPAQTLVTAAVGIPAKASVNISAGAGSSGIGYSTDDSALLAASRGEDTPATATPAVPRWHQILTLCMFGAFVLGILLEKQTGINAYIIGIIAIAVLVATRALPEKTALSSISWSTLFFVGGILVLAGTIVSTGASQLIVDVLVKMLGGSPNPYVLIGGMFLISLIMTQFMSNTAAAGILAPIAISLATGIGGDPRALVMAVVLGASCAFLTAIATPPNIMVAEPGNIKFVDWIRSGLPLSVMAFVVCMVIVPLVWPVYA
ncbi:SLC13 family permease [Arthrobacter sp. MYb227]|uniref:SLC13 family permease n=1 Tax=Arthrobacter sp. MYb227 TaxID=1848601 RepID=UPI0015E3A8EB|nr:SLC13 family permease [Arthrobacter sp. MYb227]